MTFITSESDRAAIKPIGNACEEVDDDDGRKNTDSEHPKRREPQKIYLEVITMGVGGGLAAHNGRGAGMVSEPHERSSSHHIPCEPVLEVGQALLVFTACTLVLCETWKLTDKSRYRTSPTKKKTKGFDNHMTTMRQFFYLTFPLGFIAHSILDTVRYDTSASRL